MTNELDPNILAYCANFMHPQIEVLKNSAKKINKRKNIEDIHDLRVASRRIRTSLSVFTDCFPAKKLKIWEKDIKEITKSYGRVRDLDVQIDLIDKIYESVKDPKTRSGLRRIRLRLKQRRQIRQEKTNNATQEILSSPTLAEMAAWCSEILPQTEIENKKALSLYQIGYKNIQNRLDEFLFFEVFIFDPARVEELHQMRIAVKRLRYSLEIFSDLYDKQTDFALDIARQTQQYLGEIHDADVWINFLPKFMENEQQRIRKFYGYLGPYSRLKTGIEYLISDRKKERIRQYQKFLGDWRNWKLKESWLNLRKIIFLTNLNEAKSLQEEYPNNSENIKS